MDITTIENIRDLLSEYKSRFHDTEKIDETNYPFPVIKGISKLNSGDRSVSITDKYLTNNNGTAMYVKDGERIWASAALEKAPIKYVVEIDWDSEYLSELESFFGGILIKGIKFVGIDTRLKGYNEQGYHLSSFEDYQYLTMEQWVKWFSNYKYRVSDVDHQVLQLNDFSEVYVEKAYLDKFGNLKWLSAVDIDKCETWTKPISVLDIRFSRKVTKEDTLIKQIVHSQTRGWTTVIMNDGYKWTLWQPKIDGDYLKATLIYNEYENIVDRRGYPDLVCQINNIKEVETPYLNYVEQVEEKFKLIPSHGWVTFFTAKGTFVMLNPKKTGLGYYSSISLDLDEGEIYLNHIWQLSDKEIIEMRNSTIGEVRDLMNNIVSSETYIKVKQNEETFFLYKPKVAHIDMHKEHLHLQNMMILKMTEYKTIYEEDGIIDLLHPTLQEVGIVTIEEMKLILNYVSHQYVTQDLTQKASHE